MTSEDTPSHGSDKHAALLFPMALKIIFKHLYGNFIKSKIQWKKKNTLKYKVSVGKQSKTLNQRQPVQPQLVEKMGEGFVIVIITKQITK